MLAAQFSRVGEPSRLTMFRERNNIIDFHVATFQTCKKRNGASETRSFSYSISPSSYHGRKQICHRRLDRLRCPLSPRLIILQHPFQFRRDVIDSQRTEVNCSFSSMDFHLLTVFFRFSSRFKAFVFRRWVRLASLFLLWVPCQNVTMKLWTFWKFTIQCSNIFLILHIWRYYR